jgi:hypothetical protein
MSPELISAIQAALERLESWKGRLVTIEESISRAVGESFSYDRHFCTRTRFSLIVEFAGWFFSGSALAVEGSQAGRPAGYQLTLDRVVAVDLSDDGSVGIKERFGQAAERLSVFRLVPEAGPV